MNITANIYRGGEDTENTITGALEASGFLSLKADGSYGRTYKLSTSDLGVDICPGDELRTPTGNYLILGAQKTENSSDALEVSLIAN